MRGALAMALSRARDGRAFVLPAASAGEAALVRDATVYGAPSLLAVCAHLAGRAPLAQAAPDAPRRGAPEAPIWPTCAARRTPSARSKSPRPAAHSLLLIGPPGTGKSMLAQRLPALLPPLTEDEALEVAAVASIAGRFAPQRWGERPFRAPHHTASGVALVGGGSDPRPGEISLAHHGVLFLDELPEWDRRVLEVLREPLESGVIHISRAARQSTFPAQFQLVAAMNPCPCGWLGDASGRCHCTPDRVARYRSRVSGPLLDRIDLALEVPAVAPESLAMNAHAIAWRKAPTRTAARAGTSARATRANRRRRCARASSARASGSTTRQGKPNARLLPAGSRAALRARRRRPRNCSRRR